MKTAHCNLPERHGQSHPYLSFQALEQHLRSSFDPAVWGPARQGECCLTMFQQRQLSYVGNRPKACCQAGGMR